MAVELELDKKAGLVRANAPQSVSSLVNGHFGYMKKGILELFPEEALYLMDIRNAEVRDRAQNTYTFNDVAAVFRPTKQMARYFTYKDWRDRGLIARQVIDIAQSFGRNPTKKYPEGKFEPPKYSMRAHFYSDDLFAIIDDDSSAKSLYEQYWFGQYATYKAEQRGKLGKLDIYETLFLMKHAGLSLDNAKEKDVIKIATDRRPDFKSIYDVYEDWRLSGFILKTGFKFGTHFRIYFPGASPIKGGDWVHSQHVLHVFPRTSRLLISEWARAIRVAHSVRKTFVLAINGQKKKATSAKKEKSQSLSTHLDFLLYHRQGTNIENPKSGKPKYLMLSLSEEEYLGGEEMAAAIEDCKKIGLELMIAIADRETSVTYYAVKRIDIPASEYEYYEIEWVQP